MQLHHKKLLVALDILTALSKLKTGQTKPLKEIIKEKGLATAYAEQVAFLLKNAQIIIATRGAYGGYCLKDKPTAINLWKINEALRTAKKGATKPHSKNQKLIAIENQITEQTKAQLQKISLDCFLNEKSGA